MIKKLNNEELRIKQLLNDYKNYKEAARTPLMANKYHAFRSDLEAVVKLCESKISELKIQLQKLK